MKHTIVICKALTESSPSRNCRLLLGSASRLLFMDKSLKIIVPVPVFSYFVGLAESSGIVVGWYHFESNDLGTLVSCQQTLIKIFVDSKD